jgi:hypothetical protein
MKCEKCNKEHNGFYGSGRFCSRECANTRSHSDKIKRQISISLGGTGKLKKIKKCLHCSKETYNGKFCSEQCFRDYKWKQYCDEVEKQNGFPWCGNSTNRRAKKYIVLKRGNKCEICGITKWRGKPAPLVLDHIDGKGNNWSLNNLRLVCGNCDMQLPTYKSKNKGNCTRKGRYQLSN